MNTSPDFQSLCEAALHDLRTCNTSLMALWHHACERPHPFAGLLIEPMLSDITDALHRLERMRAIDAAVQQGGGCS